VRYKVKENSIIAYLAAIFLKQNKMAIVIGATIFLYNISRVNFENDKKHLAHELCHINQFRQYGILKFIILYLWESLKKGYWNNKFEVEARDSENQIV
jgi:hypothetical protein